MLMCARTVSPSSLMLRHKQRPTPRSSTVSLRMLRTSVTCWGHPCLHWWLPFIVPLSFYHVSSVFLEWTVIPPSPQCREYVSQYSSLVVEQLMNMVSGSILLFQPVFAYLKPVLWHEIQKRTRKACWVYSLLPHFFLCFPLSCLSFLFTLLHPPLHVVVLFPYFMRCSPGTGRSFWLACSVQPFSWTFVVLSVPALAWRCGDLCTRSLWVRLLPVLKTLLFDPWLLQCRVEHSDKTPFLWSEWQQRSTAVGIVLY